MTETEALDSQVERILRRAAELYEANPRGGLHGQPFIFTLDGQDGEEVVTAHPVVVQVDPMVLATVGKYGGKAMEQLALEALRQQAAQVAPGRLAAVGYLFPAEGDFPQNPADAKTATWLRAQKSTTPWEKEGVVMILDRPEERRTYAALRERGEVADPLSDPAQMVVFCSHVPKLYPFDPGCLTPTGGWH